MGEREITERIEVSDREKVHLCDFCARSSEEFDGTFNDIYVNPQVTIKNQWHPRRSDGAGNVIVSDCFAKPENVYLNCDERKHFCNECYAAHIEVHNDDN